MAPTESSVLSNFLLAPAPLPVIITEKQFLGLFPKARQTDPILPVLYRELQEQRAVDTDEVKRNIGAEVLRGRTMLQQISRARRRAAGEGMHDLNQQELQMEQELHGSSSDTSLRKEHSIQTLLPQLERACKDVQTDIEELEAQAETLLASAKDTIGSLSDLRYGRVAYSLEDIVRNLDALG